MRKSLLLLLGLTTWCVSAFSSNYVLSKNPNLGTTEQTQTNFSFAETSTSVFAKFLRNELLVANNVQNCDGLRVFNAKPGTCANDQITWNIPNSGDNEPLANGYPRVVDLSNNSVVAVNPDNQPITLPVGEYEIQYVYTGDDVCNIPVRVNDTQDPVFDGGVACGAIYGLDTDPNDCIATIPANTVEIPTGTDNCDGNGASQIAWTVIDIFDGPISDTTDANAGGFLPDSIQFGEGINVVLFTLFDFSGNEVTCTAEVTVTDENAPVFIDNFGVPVDTVADFVDQSLPADPGVCFATAGFDLPNALDTCLGPIPTEWTVLDGAMDTLGNGLGDISNFQFPAGISRVHVETTDGRFFLRFAFDVEVVDLEAPVVTDCPSDFDFSFATSNNGIDDCLADVTFGGVTVTDNCPGNIDTTWFIASKDTVNLLFSGNNFPFTVTLEPDTYLVAYGAVDAIGNPSDLCFAKFTVVDDEAPKRIGGASPGNQDLLVDANCEADYTITVPNVDDNSTGCAGLGGFFQYYTLTELATGDTIQMDTVSSGTLNVTETFGLGDFIVTWVAEDVYGNSTLIESYQISVTDEIDPTINTAVFSGSTDTTLTMSSLTGATVQNGCGVLFTIPGISVDDNCSVASVVANRGNLNPGTLQLTDTLNEGLNTFIYTVTDGSGNTASANVNITLVDDIAPKLNGDFAYPNINENAAAGKCSFSKSWNILNFFRPTDNCADELDSLYVVLTLDVFGTPSVDTLVARRVANIGSTERVNVTFPGPNKQHLVEVFATDKSGNVVTKSFQVSTVDAEAPVISFQDTLRVFVNAANCTTGRDTIIIGTDLVSDNCTNDATLIANMTNSETPALGDTLYLEFPIDPNPFHSISFTTEDEVGNSFTKNIIVHIVDTLLPGIDLTPLDTVENDPGVCEGTTKVFAPVSSDACGIATVEYSINGAAFATLPNNESEFPFTFPAGSNEIVWQVTDSNSNVSLDTQRVVIIDTEAPMITAIADIDLVTNPGECGRDVTVPFPDVTDNCSLDSAYFTFTDNGGFDTILPNGADLVASIEPGITYTGMVYAVDTVGNIDSIAFTIDLRDVEAPTISCPSGSITIQANTPDCEARVIIMDEFAFNPMDNCGDILLLGFDGVNFFDPTQEYAFEVGITPVKIYVGDAAGNIDSCTFNAVVENNIESHIFDFPTDTVIGATANECSKRYFWSEPRIIGGDCDGESIEVVSNFNSGDDFPIDETIVTYTFYRLANNGDTLETYTQSFSVTVEDRQAPVLTQVPADRNLFVDGSCTAELSYEVDVQDNCDAQGLNIEIADSLQSGSRLPVGDYNVVIRVTDQSGNTAVDSFMVVVRDNVAPTVTVPNTVVNVCGTNFDPATYVNATDACGIASLVVTPAATAGLNTYTVVATDNNNNQRTASFQINAIDNRTATVLQSPNAEICEGSTVPFEASAPGAGQTGTWTSAVGSVVIADPNSPVTNITFNNPGTYAVTWTLDNSGACANSSATVNVVVLEETVASVSQSTLIAEDGEVTLNGNDAPGVDNGTWTTTNTEVNIVNENDPNTRVSNINVQTEFVWTIDIAGCAATTAEVTVLVPAVKVETGFTPNNASNQYWDLSNITNNSAYAGGTVKVYNRWGNLVFESTIADYQGDGRWDGTHEGNELPTASYFFVIDPNSSDAEVLTGNVTIIR